MSNEENPSTNSPQLVRVLREMSLEQAHIMRQDNAIIALQQSVRQSNRQLEQITTQFMAL